MIGINTIWQNRIERNRIALPCPVLKSAKGNRTEQTRIEQNMTRKNRKEWDTSRPGRIERSWTR